MHGRQHQRNVTAAAQLNIIGLLDDYDMGEYMLDGKLMEKMSETKGCNRNNSKCRCIVFPFLYSSHRSLHYATLVLLKLHPQASLDGATLSYLLSSPGRYL